MSKIVRFCPAFDTRLIIRQLPSLILLLTSASAFAAPRELQNVIDDYVAEGMHSNLALQAETYSVQQAKATLDEARSHYLPELSFNASYSWAHGGRQMIFPSAMH